MNGAQEGCVQIKAGTEHTPFPKMGGEYTCLPLQWVLLCPSAEPAFDHLDITSGCMQICICDVFSKEANVTGTKQSKCGKLKLGDVENFFYWYWVLQEYCPPLCGLLWVLLIRYCLCMLSTRTVKWCETMNQ